MLVEGRDHPATGAGRNDVLEDTIHHLRRVYRERAWSTRRSCPAPTGRR